MLPREEPPQAPKHSSASSPLPTPQATGQPCPVLHLTGPRGRLLSSSEDSEDREDRDTPCEGPKCRECPRCWYPSFSPHRREGPQEDMPQGDSKFLVPTQSPKLVLRAPTTQKQNGDQHKREEACSQKQAPLPSAEGKTLPREHCLPLIQILQWLGVLGQKPQASEKTQLPPEGKGGIGENALSLAVAWKCHSPGTSQPSLPASAPELRGLGQLAPHRSSH